MAGDGGDAEPGWGLDGFLADVLKTVPGQAATFYTPDLELGSPDGFWRCRGMPAEALRDYMAHYRDVDEWARAASRLGRPGAGTLLDTDRLVDRRALVRTEFHAGYLDPYEIGRCLVGIVDDGRGRVLPRIRLTVVRAPGEPAFSPADADQLALLTRLGRSFVGLAKAHETTAHAAMLQQATIDLVRMPILLVDGERRIDLLNRSARDLLRLAGPLLRREGRLLARDPTADRTLGEALRRVQSAPGDVRIVRLGVGRLGVRAPALLITAITDAATGGVAGLVVRVLGPEPAAADGEAVLKALLGLTPAEAAVALGLAEGLSNEEIARRRGVKVTTVRTTLRRLQEKLGIRKSSRLARFILGITSTGGLRL